jgi:hypothetical protein
MGSGETDYQGWWMGLKHAWLVWCRGAGIGGMVVPLGRRDKRADAVKMGIVNGGTFAFNSPITNQTMDTL